jgi:hypothetical protein
VGGWFGTAGGVAAEYLARWDGSTWSAVRNPGEPGVDSHVHTLLARTEGAGPALYVGGTFVTASGLTVNGIARWDGQGWSALPGPAGVGLEPNGALALSEVNDGSGSVLVIGGSFLLAGGLEANRIARWDGSELGWWSPPDGAGLSYYTISLAVHEDGGGRTVYAGGVFTHASGGRVNGIARWGEGVWAPLSGPAGTGLMGGFPWSLTSCGVGGTPGLFAGGDFVEAGGLLANGVARWDGAEWSELYGLGGPGVTSMGWLPGSVYASACLERASGPALVVGGEFDAAGGAPAASLALWNGSGWATLSGPSGEGVDGTVHALAATCGGDAPVLYVGGSFDTAGGVAAASVAAWDGAAWSALEGPAGNGLDGYASALALYDPGLGPELFVGGDFTTAGGLPAAALARWDGSAWSAVPGFSDLALDQVGTLAVHDDGSGPALYVTASRVDGVTIADFALLRWDGSTWTVLVDEPIADLWGPVAAMTSFDDGTGPALWLGGPFRRMGGNAAAYVTRYFCDARLFADGFETGTAGAWSLVVP